MTEPGVAGTFQDMLEVVRTGDYLLEWNTTPISYSIEEITERVVNGHEEHGPSHVVNPCDFPEYSDEFYEMEAVFIYGCRLLPLSHYAKSKNRMLLCRRKGATPEDISKAIGTGLGLLGRGYEIKEELEIALHTLVPWHPFQQIHPTENHIFCSELTQYMWQQTSVPFGPAKDGGNRTPMGLMLDVGTEYVMWCN